MKRYLAGTLLLLGIGLVFIEILTHHIGTGHGPPWGDARILLLSSGLLVFALGAWVPSRERVTGTAIPQDLTRLPGRRKDQILEWLQIRPIGIASAMLVLAAIAVYAFFGSTGTWWNWPDQPLL